MSNTREHPDRYFNRIWQSFISNIGALWLFSEYISQMTDQLDRQQVGEMAEAFREFFSTTGY